MGRGHHREDKTKSEKEDIKIARRVDGFSTVIHFYKWIKPKMQSDCCYFAGYGRIIKGGTFCETKD